MQSKDSWSSINLEEFKVKHGLQAFQVRFYPGGDDLTYQMINQYQYDHTHLLTTVGQLEAGLRFPLYRSGDDFAYQVLASRGMADGSACRSIVQYNGNFFRVLEECSLRSKGRSRLSCYTPDPSQRSMYTAENFHATYKDYISAHNRKKWSVGLARRKLTWEQVAAGRQLLLTEIDGIKIKYVPGMEGTGNPIPFPKDQKLRDDHDFRWHRTPIEIIGPWAWGWEHRDRKMVRLTAPSRFGNYVQWDFNGFYFSFDYRTEEQFDFSAKAKIRVT